MKPNGHMPSITPAILKVVMQNIFPCGKLSGVLSRTRIAASSRPDAARKQPHALLSAAAFSAAGAKKARY